MDRREVLSTLGTGAVATTAGCGVLGGGGSCGPGEDEVRAISDRLRDGDAPESVSITGVAAQYVDPPRIDVTGNLLVLDDGTGKAVAYPPRAFEFNPDSIDTGTCVTLESTLNVSRSKTLELPVLEVANADEVSTDGAVSVVRVRVGDRGGVRWPRGNAPPPRRRPGAGRPVARRVPG